jgi:hypothetical protein
MSRDFPSLDEIYGGGAEQADSEAAACEDAMNRAYDRGASAEQIIAALDAISTPPQQQEQSGEVVEAVRYGEEAAFRFQQSTATASQESAPGQEAVAFDDWWDKQGNWAEVNAASDDYAKAKLAWVAAQTTSTAIAAMVIKQAAEVAMKMGCAGRTIQDTHREILKLTPANAEAELEALMMKVAERSFTSGYNTANDEGAERLTAIVQSVIRKG